MLSELVDLLGPDRVLTDPVDLFLYSYDASMETGRPEVVAIPRSVADIRHIVASALSHDCPYVMRGAGTGYSGGALAFQGGLVILTRDLTAILEVNEEERWVRCEPGVVLAELQSHLAKFGLRYLPDPSSHRVCTIGGNVAENAGGPHALGHGPTSNFVISLDIVLPDGSALTLRDSDVYRGGLDLRGVFVGSEGTLGVVTGVKLRLAFRPERQRVMVATFARQDDAVQAVERILAAGLTPTALDMLTGAYVPGAGETHDPSLLYVDLEGTREEVQTQCATMLSIARDLSGSARILRLEVFLRYRAELVREKVRRMIGLTGLPCYYLFDCVVPRAHLRALMSALREAAERHHLPLLNTFHAGDGNVHPAPFYDPSDGRYRDRLRAFLRDVLETCSQLDGALSGEHGIGLEKRDLLPLFHTRDELAAMSAVKQSFDPAGLCNPGKILPSSSSATARESPPYPTGPLVVDEKNGTICVADWSVTFAQCAEALGHSVFELAYEPVGGRRSDGVLAAIDAGLPGVREPNQPAARDLVLSPTFREPDGRARRFGSTCAKDVSGYELRKLAFGARGRLGRLSSVVLRLSPRPSSQRAIMARCTVVSDTVELLRELHRSRLPYGCLALTFTDGAAAVVAVLESFGGTLEPETAELRHLLESAGAEVFAEPAGRFAWWEALPRATTAYTPEMPWASRDALDRVFRASGACVLAGQRATWVTGTDSAPQAPAVADRCANLIEAVRAAW
jgi:glycolate oxidase